jgi:hypothetical protein
MVNSKRQINIPHDIAQKHGIVEEEVLRKGSEAKGLRDGLYEIGTRGMDELITARRELKGSGGKVEPRSATPVFLSAVCIYSLGLHIRRRQDPRRTHVVTLLTTDSGRSLPSKVRKGRFRCLSSRPVQGRLEVGATNMVESSNRQNIMHL